MLKKVKFLFATLLVVSIFSCAGTTTIKQDVVVSKDSVIEERGYRDYTMFPRENIILCPFEDKTICGLMKAGSLNDPKNYLSKEDYKLWKQNPETFEQSYIINFDTALVMPPIDLMLKCYDDRVGYFWIELKKAFFEDHENWSTVSEYKLKLQKEAEEKHNDEEKLQGI